MQVVSFLQRMRTLSGVAKAGIVLGGYAAAILLAVCVVSIYVYQTSGPDRDAYAGMYDFGDSLLFLAIFGAASIVPTGLALVFLRQSRGFWFALSVVAFAVAGTGLAAVAATVLEPETPSLWAMLAFPRIFLAPFLVAVFGLSGLVAPTPGFRLCLFGAAGMESVSSTYGFFHWFAPLFFH